MCLHKGFKNKGSRHFLFNRVSSIATPILSSGASSSFFYGFIVRLFKFIICVLERPQ